MTRRPRDILRNCQALPARPNLANVRQPSDAEIDRIRKVARNGTLLDSRMLVDEVGKPLR